MHLSIFVSFSHLNHRFSVTREMKLQKIYKNILFCYSRELVFKLVILHVNNKNTKTFTITINLFCLCTKYNWLFSLTVCNLSVSLLGIRSTLSTFSWSQVNSEKGRVVKNNLAYMHKVIV